MEKFDFMRHYKILNGDCLDILKTLPDNYIQCCVTSPPYYGLRDYGNDKQIGLEETPELYVKKLVAVFSEVKRILKDDGTLWLNLGDSYAVGGMSNPSGKSTLGGGKDRGALNYNIKRTIPERLKPKDLIGIPWRVAFALQADGWYLRQDIIWHKPNPMPESVTDRCTKSHEYIFLLSKSQRYYFDNEAIKEPITDSSIKRLSQDIENQTGYERIPGKTNGNMKAVSCKFGGNKYGKSDLIEARTKSGNNWENFNGLRNKRSVWTVTTKPYKEAHFATFPADLIMPCILAGSKENDIVLDPFNGSGTTGEVSLKLNRQYIGIELNPAYIELSERRLNPIIEQAVMF